MNMDVFNGVSTSSSPVMSTKGGVVVLVTVFFTFVDTVSIWAFALADLLGRGPLVLVSGFSDFLGRGPLVPGFPDLRSEMRCRC